MKIFLPLLCSFLLIGCSDSTTAKTASSAVDTVSPAVPEASSAATQPASPAAEQAASDLPAVQSATETKPASVDGGTLFGQKCVSCHGAKAEKPALGKSKIIATFSEQQIKDALHGYQNETYGKEMKAVMQGQAKSLSDDEIDALAHYISTL